MSEPNQPNTDNNPPIQPGSEEYNQRMADRYRSQSTQTDPNRDDLTPGIEPKPEDGLEKYYNAETGEYNWAAHARELQYNLNGRPKGTDNNQEGDNRQTQDGPEGDQSTGDEQVDDVLSKAGLSVEDLQSQLVDGGDISAEAREALVKQGIPQALIDSYVSMAKTAMESTQAQAVDYAGGDTEWQTMQSWARENMEPSEVQQINTLLASPNWKLGIDALKARYQGASRTAGESTQLQTGQRNNVSDGYTSKAQMIQDIRDPRYRTDPVFRREVAERVRHAKFEQ